MKEDIEILICDCGSFDHQIVFWYEEKEGGTMYTHPNLTTHRNFFKRLWYGLRYAFGYKSRFGAFDEFVFSKNNEKRLYDYLKQKYELITDDSQVPEDVQ